MTVSAINIFTDYHRIKKDNPSYRLGQHYCNVIGMPDTVYKGVDLFTVSNDTLADNIFYEMCDVYSWPVFDLPIFGKYDLTTIKTI
ncbi:hypothetical protein NVP1121O_074 [Vibrio phage 1.121.O._10N.286.46.C4]|nr:hypothetical protein NVP1121O_074 [Vibrio phage 1.121.O._10N.286.46.C4]